MSLRDFSDRAMERISKSVRWTEGHGRTPLRRNMRHRVTAFSRTNWVPFKNTGSATIPAFGVVYIHGATDVDADTDFVLSGKQPDADPLPSYVVAFNGQNDITQNKFGLCTFDIPAFVLYNTANTPAAGEIWGADKTTNTLMKNHDGFIVSSVTATTPDRVLVIGRVPNRDRLAKTNSVFSSGTATAALYTDAGVATTEQNITVRDPEDLHVTAAVAKVASGAWCMASPTDTVGTFTFYPLECA